MPKLLALALYAFLAGCLLVAGFVSFGYWTYKRHEKEIVERMDQYYLTITSPAHEQYLLEGDETFEVPYMASKLSVAAVPTRIYDAREKVIGEFSTEKGQYVTDPNDLPIFLRRALVASEDGTFYQHHGINYRATARAILTDIRHMRKAQGGSTITQQLAKVLFTTRKKTPGRKIYEFFCAKKIEEKFTKDQILLMYFDFIYFGHGAWGVESASHYYFQKPAKQLELAEAAMLVGIIPNPSKYSPYENLAFAQARQRTVLTRMAKLNFVPASQIERISEEFWKKMAARSRIPEISFWRMKVNEAPYVIEFLRRNMLKDFTKERLMKGGLKIHTTFDLEVQKAAEAALAEGLREENAADAAGQAVTGSPIEGSLAALRPSDGAILALVGGSGFNFQNQLVRAVDAQRPIGSSVKPFVYAVAFDSGKYKPSDEFTDEPLHFDLPGGRKWDPQNYGRKYFGKVTLETALHKSMNSVAIQLLRAVGVGDVVKALAAATGKDAEFFESNRNLSLALGTVDMSVLDMARAYALFDNGGSPVTPYFIRYIEDRDGAVVHDERQRPPPAPPIFKPDTISTMTVVMRGVLGPEGSGYPAARKTGFNIPAAGKTGTTNDYRDAWFVGFTPDISAAVWMGHDDMRVPLRQGMAGGAVAAPAWMYFVKGVYRNRPTRDFDTAGPKK
ncbi:MAG: PBP1A family penicillin-binding protein [Elusimicrobia bacterium]|nr:PBP1A family penicillin-binding protein [Elusimicrobiota bacterium]